jgi:hypothetical protein
MPLPQSSTCLRLLARLPVGLRETFVHPAGAPRTDRAPFGQSQYPETSSEFPTATSETMIQSKNFPPYSHGHQPPTLCGCGQYYRMISAHLWPIDNIWRQHSVECHWLGQIISKSGCKSAQQLWSSYLLPSPIRLGSTR